jgi:peptide/nickel transport system permease protein
MSGVVKFTLQRLPVMLPTLLFVSILVFSLQQLLPGDPALALSGDDHDPEVIAQIRQKYGFDQPLPVQYATWLWNVLRGDLGMSYRTHLTVLELIASKLPVTIELATFAMLIALVLGIPAGVYAATRQGTASGLSVNLAALSGISVPHFWLGIMMILLFSVYLGWLPSSGYVPPWVDLKRNLMSLIMPAFVLGTGVAGVIMRHTQSAMIEVLGSDYIRTARSNGLTERRIISKHALRNALIPVITLSTIEFGKLLSGAILTEQIFSIPGFGKLIVDAVFNREYAVVQGVVLVAATLYILLSFIADLLYYLVNPRMRT